MEIRLCLQLIETNSCDSQVACEGPLGPVNEFPERNQNRARSGP